MADCDFISPPAHLVDAGTICTLPGNTCSTVEKQRGLAHENGALPISWECVEISDSEKSLELLRNFDACCQSENT